MLLTEKQKRVLELLRKFGGLKAVVLKRLSGDEAVFDPILKQLIYGGYVYKTDEYICDDSNRICDRKTETALEVMLCISEKLPEVFLKGNPPFTLTFFKENPEIVRYDICVAEKGKEIILNAMLEGMNFKKRVLIYVLEALSQAEQLAVPYDYYFAIKEKESYRFFNGGKENETG